MAVSQWGIVSDAYRHKCLLPTTVMVAQMLAADASCSFWANVL